MLATAFKGMWFATLFSIQISALWNILL